MITFTTTPEVLEVRARIREIKEELAATESAALCDAEAEAKIREVISTHAARAQPDRILAHLIHVGSSSHVAWPADHQGNAIEPSAFDLLCAFDTKRVETALRSLVAKSPHLRGPASSERISRSSELRSALDEAEIEEERLIEAAEVRGINVQRRADANPAIILGAHTCT